MSSQSSLVAYWKTDLLQSYCSYNIHKVFFSQANSVLLLCSPSVLMLLSIRCLAMDLCHIIIYVESFETLRVVLYNYCLLGNGPRASFAVCKSET
jgi:hypothetical protein